MDETGIERERQRLEGVYATILRLRAAGVVRPDIPKAQAHRRARQQQDHATAARYVIGLLRHAATKPADIPFVRNAREQGTKDDIALICNGIADALEGKE